MPTTPSPYTPTSTKIYYHSNLNKEVRGVYITSETSIKVLFYQSATKLSYIAILTLSSTSSTFSLQPTLPQMPVGFQTLGVFSSDGSKYYMSSRGYTFYTNLTPAT